MRVALLLVLVLFLVSFGVLAASFDCSKARSEVEHLICNNPQVSNLDEDLAKSYRQHLERSVTKTSARNEQRMWLTEVRDICTTVDCLEGVYRERIEELSTDSIPGRFRTVFYKEKPLCDAYKRYVEHEVEIKKQYGHYTSPMCQRAFGDEFPEFGPVKWREIKPQDHADLAVQAYRYINFWPWSRPEVAVYLTESQFQRQLDEIVLKSSYNWWHMWLGEANIGNTGHLETLLKIEDGRCGELSHKPALWSMPVMVVDSDGKGIDTTKSEWVLGVTTPSPSKMVYWPPNIKPIPGLHATTLSTFDVFDFSGKTFFDQWLDVWDLPRSALADRTHATLTVYGISHGSREMFCQFKFNKYISDLE